MSPRSGFAIAACVMILIIWSGTASAQNRFTVRTQDAIADVSGLRVLTLNDNQSSQCYTLFIFEPPTSGSSTGPAVPPAVASDDTVEQSLQRIREAAATRDRQLAELKARGDGFTVKWFNSGDGREDSFYFPSNADEAERRRIEGEYDRALQAEIGTYAWPTRLPGNRSGGWDDTAANTQRRAMLDPEPSATMRAVMDRLTRLEDLLNRLAEGPRLAVSGPAACSKATETNRPH